MDIAGVDAYCIGSPSSRLASAWRTRVRCPRHTPISSPCPLNGRLSARSAGGLVGPARVAVFCRRALRSFGQVVRRVRLGIEHEGEPFLVEQPLQKSSRHCRTRAEVREIGPTRHVAGFTAAADCDTHLGASNSCSASSKPGDQQPSQSRADARADQVARGTPWSANRAPGQSRGRGLGLAFPLQQFLRDIQRFPRGRTPHIIHPERA